MFKKSGDIFNSAAPLLIYLKVFGIFVPSFERNGIPFKIRILDKIYFSLVFCLMLSNFIFKVFKPVNSLNSSQILNTAWEICGNLSLFSILFMMIYQYRKAGKFVKILKLLNEIDGKVNCELG